MTTGELLTRTTALCSFLLYVLALIAARRLWVQRLLWTMACLVYLGHVFCAFQFLHHWSHTAALSATALQTYEVVGLHWGGGLYVNYAFTIVWCADVCWWWLQPAGYLTRSWAAASTLHVFLGFMWFNATVVFGRGMTRASGILAFVLVFAVWALRTIRSGGPSARR